MILFQNLLSFLASTFLSVCLYVIRHLFACIRPAGMARINIGGSFGVGCLFSGIPGVCGNRIPIVNPDSLMYNNAINHSFYQKRSVNMSRKKATMICFLIVSCFLWTGSGYLSWMDTKLPDAFDGWIIRIFL